MVQIRFRDVVRTIAIIFLLQLQSLLMMPIVMVCALPIVSKLAKDMVTQVGFVHLSEKSQAVAVHQKRKKLNN
ncbi:hypothetical protein Bca52824_012291 [Brassica carinata]|uniref:Uncharacterized protein n=1 Tax=Brassica carinata TaxID=52824 RepID=A0A8X7VYK9_BRACI|nr:hypothetical protein Bca52824_012291 [Brassica carinata]